MQRRRGRGRDERGELEASAIVSARVDDQPVGFRAL